MKIKDKLKKLFYNTAPNSLLLGYIKFHLPKDNSDEIEKALEELTSEGFLNVKEGYNENCPTLNRRSWQITKDHLGDYPIQTDIELGELSIPRMLDGDLNRAEDINNVVHAFDRILEQEIKKLKNSYNRELKRVWGTVVTIFGLFLALFSLINVAIKPVYFSDKLELSQKAIILQTLYNILPLSLVLGIFLFVLYKIFKS